MARAIALYSVPNFFGMLVFSLFVVSAMIKDQALHKYCVAPKKMSIGNIPLWG
jgi:hypothetical protein